MKYLKIFDKNHLILDEIYDLSLLTYTWTLNGMGKASFSVGIENAKSTPKNFQFGNHIEIWDNDDQIWGGVLITRIFDNTAININCFGYLSLLQFRRLRLRAYASMTYGTLLQTMLTDTNTISPTGLSVGTIQSNSLLTLRQVAEADMVLAKMTEFIDDANYDIDVDNARNFNFYIRKGSNKPKYLLEYGGQADNIIADPTLTQDMQNMSNNIYSTVTTGALTLTSIAEDTNSRATYGMIEGEYSPNTGILNQSTLDNGTQAEIIRRAYPTNSIVLKIKDSSLCPFSDMFVGDSIPVSLIPYWGYKDTLRILEITHNEDDGSRDILMGQTLLRPLPPKIKIYRK